MEASPNCTRRQPNRTVRRVLLWDSVPKVPREVSTGAVSIHLKSVLLYYRSSVRRVEINKKLQGLFFLKAVNASRGIWIGKKAVLRQNVDFVAIRVVDACARL